ncbi:MAG: Ig-like domain-containing protein [Gemmatimonadales bacterium]
MLPVLFLALQQPVASTSIARVEVQPAQAAVAAGDTLRLTATAYDSAGRTLETGRVTWAIGPSPFEGGVDSTGLLTAGSVGNLTVTAFARPRAGGRGKIGQARITVLPGPAARVELSPIPARLYVGQSLPLTARSWSAAGDPRPDAMTWSSDAPAVVALTAWGRVTAVKPGRAALSARAGQTSASHRVEVVANPVTQVAIEPAAPSVRVGDVVRLRFVARDRGGNVVADAVPEWSLAPGQGIIDADGGFVAEQVGMHRVVASFAGRSAESVIEARPRDAVRPTRLVGRLSLTLMGGEFWLHPDGRHGYLTTIADRIYALDLADPSKPAITDSILVDARTINDLMTTEDGKYGVLTREGASNRKNGIVILSFEDPAHPRVIAEYTETVSGGVHSTFVYKGYIYLTDDATGSMRVIDIREPAQPREVARWETSRAAAGRMLHDIAVHDGLAYLSYWNDGLVVLDVGNGMKGGSPESPRLVSQFKYDLDALYRHVEAIGGPGFIRGTHTAWRHRDYVFIADEVFSGRPAATTGPRLLGFGRAFGRMQVLDVKDIEHPRLVAWFEPTDGGTHNLWVAGDTLYLGDYQGGLRVVDISGELRGDLMRQGREVAHVDTGDPNGLTPNAPMAWGALYHDGLIYVNDVNSGLWIVKVEERASPVP